MLEAQRHPCDCVFAAILLYAPKSLRKSSQQGLVSTGNLPDAAAPLYRASTIAIQGTSILNSSRTQDEMARK